MKSLTIIFYKDIYPVHYKIEDKTFSLIELVQNIIATGNQDYINNCSIYLYTHNNITFPVLTYNGDSLHQLKDVFKGESLLNKYSAEEINLYFNDQINYLTTNAFDLYQDTVTWEEQLTKKSNNCFFKENNSLPDSCFISKQEISQQKDELQEEKLIDLTKPLAENKIEVLNNTPKNFNNIDIEKDRLKIEQGDLPNAKYISSIWSAIIKENGIPFSISELERVYKTATDKTKEYDKEIKEELTDLYKGSKIITYIDYSSRKSNEYSLVRHLVNLGIIPKSHINNSGFINFRSETLRVYKKDAEMKNNHKLAKLFDNILNYIKNNKILSNLQKLRNTYINYNSSLSYSAVLEKELDLFLLNSSYTRVLSTNRIQVVEPNIQGLQPEIKECIGYSLPTKQKKIMSMDIKGQDTHVLIYGVLKDKELIKSVEKFGDPIYGILEQLGYEPSPRNRKLGKVPVLGIMNGKSYSTLFDEVETAEDKKMLEDIYYYIVRNPNYANLRTKAEELFYSNSKYKECLLGTKGYIDRLDAKGNPRAKYNVVNSLINCNFQMTSASIFNLSSLYLIHDLLNGNITYNGEVIDFSIIRPIAPVFDEVIVEYKDGYEELTEKVLKYYYLPYILDWSDTMKSEITCGNLYKHK